MISEDSKLREIDAQKAQKDKELQRLERDLESLRSRNQSQVEELQRRHQRAEKTIEDSIVKVQSEITGLHSAYEARAAAMTKERGQAAKG